MTIRISFWPTLSLLLRSFWPLGLVSLIVGLLLYATSHSVVLKPGIWQRICAAIDVSRWPIMGKSPSPLMLGDSIMYIAILGVMGLVACNTAVVLKLFLDGNKKESDFGITLTPDQKLLRTRIRTSRSWIMWILLLIVVFLVIWVVLSAFGILLDTDRAPSEQQLAHEIVAAIVFSVFLLVDLWLLRIIRQEASLWTQVADGASLKVAVGHEQSAWAQLNIKLTALLHEQQFQRDSIALIDLPVLFGVGTIFLVHLYLHHHEWEILADRNKIALEVPLELPGNLDLYANDAVERDSHVSVAEVGDGDTSSAASGSITRDTKRISQERQRRRFAGFVQGFATGGVMMHIAISQVILGVLLRRMFAAEWRSENSSRHNAFHPRQRWSLIRAMLIRLLMKCVGQVDAPSSELARPSGWPTV